MKIISVATGSCSCLGKRYLCQLGARRSLGETCKNRRQGSGMMILVLRGKKQVRISRFKVNYETLIMSVKNKYDRKLNIEVVLLSNILTMLRKFLAALKSSLSYRPCNPHFAAYGSIQRSRV